MFRIFVWKIERCRYFATPYCQTGRLVQMCIRALQPMIKLNAGDAVSHPQNFRGNNLYQPQRKEARNGAQGRCRWISEQLTPLPLLLECFAARRHRLPRSSCGGRSPVANQIGRDSTSRHIRSLLTVLKFVRKKKHHWHKRRCTCMS